MNSNKMVHIPYRLKAAILGLPAILIGLQLSLWVYFATSVQREMLTDFPHHYRIGCMLREGRATDIYNTDPVLEQRVQDVGRNLAPLDDDLSFKIPYLHAAFGAPLFFPLAFLPLHAAYLLWIAMHVPIVVGIYRLLLPQLPTLSTLRPWVPFSMLLAFAYVPRAILFGQDSVILLLILCGSFAFVVKGDLFAGGVILGLGNFRFQHTLVIALLFLAWKAWKFAAGYLASGLGCTLVSLALTGLNAQIKYVHLLVRASHWEIRGDMDNLRGVLAWLGVSDFYTPIVILCFVALAAMLGRRLSRRNQFLFAVVAMCLGSAYLFFYDLAMLLLPIAVLLEDAVAEGSTALAGFALAIFAAPVWVLFAFHVNQAQVIAALVLSLFVVVARTKVDAASSPGKFSVSVS